jgi:hypothetical protein
MHEVLRFLPYGMEIGSEPFFAPIGITMKKNFIAAFIFAALFIASYSCPAPADIAGCKCYCNIILRPPCGDDACKRACGWQEPAQPVIPEPAPDPVAEQHRQAEDFNGQGVLYYRARNWARAIEMFRAALEKWPDNQEFRRNLDNAREAERRERDASVRKSLKGELDKQKQDDVRLNLKDELDKQADDDLRIGLREEFDKKAKDEKGSKSGRQAGSLSRAEITMMLEDLRKVKPPPEIPPGDASIGFRLLKPGDKESEDLLLGRIDRGVAAFEIMGTLAGKALPWAKGFLIAGNVFIAMENGADVYLVKQNMIYERALHYLKDRPTAALFASTVDALKHNRPLPKNATGEMISTARAIIDPKLGNSSRRIARDALWSPDALKAGMTKAAIELGSEYVIGHEAKGIVKKLQSERDPVFRYATHSLTRAESALAKTSNPAERAALEKVIAEANRLIARSYAATEPAARAVGANAWIYSKEAMDSVARWRKRAQRQ